MHTKTKTTRKTKTEQLHDEAKARFQEVLNFAFLGTVKNVTLLEIARDLLVDEFEHILSEHKLA